MATREILIDFDRWCRRQEWRLQQRPQTHAARHVWLRMPEWFYMTER